MTPRNISPAAMMLRSRTLALAVMFLCCCCCLCDGASSSRISASSSQRAPIIRFASFNIQVFGRKKASNRTVMDTLASILSRYDIMVIMEIRDSSGEAFRQLVAHTNRGLGNDPFAYVISERTGRTVSKEQYAVLYRHSVAKVLSDFTVPDPGDRFQREPYQVSLALRAGGNEFVPIILLCLHTEPDKTVTELNALHDLALPMKAKNLLIAGDLNADCSYVTKTEMASLRLRHDPNFKWLIGDGVDTTVKSTNCAYDRLIVTNSAQHMVASPRVFRFDLEYRLSAKDAARVSDHYPVELDILV